MLRGRRVNSGLLNRGLSVSDNYQLFNLLKRVSLIWSNWSPIPILQLIFRNTKLLSVLFYKNLSSRALRIYVVIKSVNVIILYLIYKGNVCIKSLSGSSLSNLIEINTSVNFYTMTFKRYSQSVGHSVDDA